MTHHGPFVVVECPKAICKHNCHGFCQLEGIKMAYTTSASTKDENVMCDSEGEKKDTAKNSGDGSYLLIR